MNIQFPELILQNLIHGGDNIACIINESKKNYRDFGKLVGSIQAKILRTGSTTIGIVTQNHISTYAAIIATWLSGKAYVPIDASYPSERLKSIFEESEITHVFCAEGSNEMESKSSEFTPIIWINCSDLPPAAPFNTYPDENKNAYILFTSGTTGKPKGVPISFGNLQCFINGFNQIGYKLDSTDRFLQMFELTFDLSVMCFAIPLTLGASFYTLPSGMIKTLGLYHTLESHEITFCLMVPSAINLLKPYFDDIELPSLKYSQFCGEALKFNLVAAWSKCIPNARIDNVYGPTEATIYCTTQTIDAKSPELNSLNGIVGIGKPMHEVKVALFKEKQKIETAGLEAELCIAGEQVTTGYLNNELQNSKSFFIHENKRYYRTGDLVVQNKLQEIFYVGRSDDQVKIQGFRIELAEIELAASHILPAHTSIAIGFQDAAENWMLALFIQNLTADPEIIKGEIASRLPGYMSPNLVLSIAEFPLNSNGKTDKKELRKYAFSKL